MTTASRPDALFRVEFDDATPTEDIYIPEPDGTWGMIFQLRIDDEGRPFLAFLAFGTRHPTSPGALSVYEVAHHRIHVQPPGADRTK